MRPLRPPAALVLVALTALIGAGCGSSAPSETGTAARAATKDTARGKAVKFAECMRNHGVGDFPDPTPKGDFPNFGISVTPAVWNKAVSACKDLQPPGTLSGKRTPTQQSAALRFAQCMRDHGVKDFPDPANGDPLIDTTKIPSLGNRSPRTDPVFAPAVKRCGVALQAALRERG